MGCQTKRLVHWVAILAVLVVGCGKQQTPIVPVSGTVTYDDGSVVPANQMEVKFLTPAKLIEEESFPPDATARVDTRDGHFPEVTTLQHGDGLGIGQHEVEVVRYGDEANPGDLTAQVYRGDKVWPSKVTVGPGKNEFMITIPKP